MALDFAKMVFGGSETDQASSSKSGSVDFTPDEYAQLRGPLTDAIRGLLSGGGSSTYGGPLFSPETGNEMDLRGMLMGQAGPGTSRSGYLDKVLGGGFLGGNPFLDSRIESAQRGVLEGLTKTLGRTLPGRFTQAGHFVGPGGSSAFDRAAAEATTGAANAMGDIATNLQFADYEAERGRQQQAVQLSQAEVDSTIKTLQAQALPRLIQELGIERGMAVFQQRTTQLLQLLQTIGAIAQPVLGTSAESSATSHGETEGGILPAITAFTKSTASGK